LICGSWLASRVGALRRSFEEASRDGRNRDANSMTLALGFDETKQRHQQFKTLQQAATDDHVRDEDVNDVDDPEQVTKGRTESIP
jgi:hypothetical protein